MVGILEFYVCFCVGNEEKMDVSDWEFEFLGFMFGK